MSERPEISRRTSLQQVAHLAGVSGCTASRVLNGKAHNIPTTTRERVRQAAQQMGYTPNRSARALATGRTYLVALQVYRLNSPYVGMVSQQMQECATRDGYEVLTREHRWGDLTVQSSVDGILALDIVHPLQSNDRLTVPYLLMGRVVPSSFQMTQSPHFHIDNVGVDLEHGARLAAEYLVKSGRRRIAYVTSIETMHEPEARWQGYRAVMEEAGLPAEFIITPSDSRESGYETIKSYTAQNSIPDALFCRNDELASGCLYALHEMGRHVPGETAVIGHDGLSEGKYYYPSLSTVSQPVEEMCRIAWQFLRKRMEEPDTPTQTVLLKPSLLLRNSA